MKINGQNPNVKGNRPTPKQEAAYKKEVQKAESLFNNLRARAYTKKTSKNGKIYYYDDKGKFLYSESKKGSETKYYIMAGNESTHIEYSFVDKDSDGNIDVLKFRSEDLEGSDNARRITFTDVDDNGTFDKVEDYTSTDRGWFRSPEEVTKNYDVNI